MSFAADLSKFAQRASGNIDLVVQKVTMDLASGVIMKSPVDTGRFRANWMFGQGSMPSGTTEAIDKGGAATLQGIISQIGKTKAGGVSYIANNLPYGQVLEDGSSDQAPSGMVKLTITEFQDYVKRAIAEVK